jgi:hypothetical protein
MDPKVPSGSAAGSAGTVEAILTQDAEAHSRSVLTGLNGSSSSAFRNVPAEHDPQMPMGRQLGGKHLDMSQLPMWRAEASQSEAHGGYDANVWIHIYHIDAYTGWLNWALLKNAEMPIYHTGVEVFGEEWAFNYFDDCWDDPTISGVISCVPKSMPGYDYQESICLGPTQLTEDQVDRHIYRLRDEWPANTYHLTRRNCISFAKAFIEVLRPPAPFPATIAQVNESSKNNPISEGVVDYGWSWAKWWMRRKYEQEQAEEKANRLAAAK